MTSRAMLVVAVLALLGGCDVSQKKPETVSPATPVTVEPPALGTTTAPAERGMRLIGPGVSRERQTRV